MNVIWKMENGEWNARKAMDSVCIGMYAYKIKEQKADNSLLLQNNMIFYVLLDKSWLNPILLLKPEHKELVGNRIDFFLHSYPFCVE